MTMTSNFLLQIVQPTRMGIESLGGLHPAIRDFFQLLADGPWVSISILSGGCRFVINTERKTRCGATTTTTAGNTTSIEIETNRSSRYCPSSCIVSGIYRRWRSRGEVHRLRVRVLTVIVVIISIGSIAVVVSST